jgi:hypothetical protein
MPGGTILETATVVPLAQEMRTLPPEIEARCFPSSDDEFAAFVSQALAELRAMFPGARPHDLAERLRASHPDVAVHERSELGELAPDLVRTWYVYRDGSLVSEA